MGGQEAALAVTFVSHVGAVPVLIWLMLRGQDDRSDWRRWWFGGDDDDVPPPTEPSGPSGDRLPLPDAEPAAVRLRGPDRLGDGYQRPARRPEHAPERRPARTPGRG